MSSVIIINGTHFMLAISGIRLFFSLSRGGDKRGGKINSWYSVGEEVCVWWATGANTGFWSGNLWRLNVSFSKPRSCWGCPGCKTTKGSDIVAHCSKTAFQHRTLSVSTYQRQANTKFGFAISHFGRLLQSAYVKFYLLPKFMDSRRTVWQVVNLSHCLNRAVCWRFKAFWAPTAGFFTETVIPSLRRLIMFNLLPLSLLYLNFIASYFTFSPVSVPLCSCVTSPLYPFYVNICINASA